MGIFLERFELAVLKAAEKFLRRQRKVVAKSMEGLFVVILGVELNHLKGHEGSHQFLRKGEKLMGKEMTLSLNDNGVLCVNWQIHNKTHHAFITPSEQALVCKNRFLVRTFFEEEESFVWLLQQISSCNLQLQDDQAESCDLDYFM